jgi:hypothetical protein
MTNKMASIPIPICPWRKIWEPIYLARFLAFVVVVVVAGEKLPRLPGSTLMVSLSGIEILIISVPGHEIIELLASGFQFAFGTLGPFIIISLSNIIIIVTVRNAAKERSKLSQQQQQQQGGKDQQKDTQFLTRMLIFVSCAYVLTSLPYRIFHVIIDTPAVSEIYDMDNIYWNLRYNIEVWFFFDWWCCNYCINFYLYCIGGGQRYRDDTKAVVKEMWKYICCKRGK